ncbi:alpha-2-macroglobulin [uncultured Gammaproteobacteria bacterium]
MPRVAALRSLVAALVVALGIFVMALMPTMPAALAEGFDPPGLAADADAYQGSLTTKTPPRPSDAKRKDALAKAQAALKARDFAKAVAGFEQAVIEGENSPDTWMSLSQAWLGGGQANPKRALQAAFLAYRLYEHGKDIPALLHLATVLDDLLTRPKDALDALEEAKSNGGDTPIPGLDQRIEGLRKRIGLTVANSRVDAEADPPTACVEFSAPLSTRANLRFEDFVKVEPAGDYIVNPRDKRLCLSGLSHGTAYTLTLRQGLPGENGINLNKDETIKTRIGDRKPSAAFRGQAFILPRTATDGIPLTTVNLETVALKLYRINDRNLAPQLKGQKVMDSIARYGAQELANEDGELIWNGKMAVKSERNRPMITPLPVRQILPETKPGLYVLTAEPVDIRDNDMPWQLATQWLLVSDLGLTATRGADGLNLFVRSFASAKPLAGVEVTLLARNNSELAKVTTDAIGRAQFSPGLAKGTGGLAPLAALASTKDGDFALLDLTLAAFDLSDRGVGGRPTPGPLDPYLYTDRGVYRPGETVNLSVLLRDDRIGAVENFPLTVKVLRPNGTVYQSGVVAASATGGHFQAIQLGRGVPMGGWTVEVYSNPKAEPLGKLGFQVEDFVPERLAVEVSAGAPLLEPGKPFEAVVKARFLYGPPAAGLTGKAEVSLQADPTPYPALRGYSFGLTQETVTPRVLEQKFSATDAEGVSKLAIEVPPAPDTTRPLRAEIRIAVAEPGGRPSRKSLSVPVRTQPYAIGIKPRFDSHRVGEDQDAGFDLLAVDPTGAPIVKDGLAYDLVSEKREYRWFMDHGRYNFRVYTRDQGLKTGTVSLSGDKGGALALGRLPYGYYRLEVYDKTTGVATSVRFSSGWVVEPQANDTPDKVEVAVDKPAYAVGDKAKVHIVPPFAGEVLLTVATDRIHLAQTLSVPASGTTVEVPVSADWGPGAYVTATVYRPPVKGQERMPVRAIGLAWMTVDPALRSINLTLDLPEKIRPNSKLEIPIHVTAAGPAGAALEEAWVTVAAVDEGILQLTDFASPDPGKHYHGKRALGLDIRDDYGRLIDTIGGTQGVLRQGGDAGGAGLPVVPITVVSLFSGPVRIDAKGEARISFDIPDFNGQLRIMAVAFDKKRVGSSAGKVIVRSPMVAEYVTPRFLAPGDDSRLTLSLHNIEAAAGGYRVVVETEGPVAVEAPALPVDLPAGSRQTLVLPLRGIGAGIGRLVVKVTGPVAGPETVALARAFQITVRPARAVETDFVIQRLEAGAQAQFGLNLVAGYLPGTSGAALSFSSAPPFDVAGLLGALDRYPYGCIEQLVSRALPLLSGGEVARILGVPVTGGEMSLASRIDFAISRVLDKQRFDGAFGLWSGRNEEERWLTGYAMEFLTRARSTGHSVAETPFVTGLNWLRHHAIDGGTDKEALASRAYALHVLALAGVATPGPARYFHDAQLANLPSPLAAAQLGSALARLGDTERARSAFGFALKHLARDWSHEDYGSTVRDAAAIITLLTETGMDKQFPEAIKALVGSLPTNDTTAARTNTQEQAWLLLAADTLMKGGAPLKLSVSGRPATAGDPVRLRPTDAELQTGLSVRNDGAAPVWQAVAVHGVPTMPRPAAKEGFKIKRGFFNRDGSVLNLDMIKQNDVFVIVLEGEALTKLYHQAIVVQPLPAGWEIENTRLGAGGTSDLAWLTDLTDALSAQMRDDRYVAAIDLTSDNPKFKFAWLVRAVTPGGYELPGASVEDMYKPRFFARQAVGRINVLPAGP